MGLINEMQPSESPLIWADKASPSKIESSNPNRNEINSFEEKPTPISPSKATFRKFLAENNITKRLVEEKAKKYESAQQAINFYKRISWERYGSFTGLIFLALERNDVEAIELMITYELPFPRGDLTRAGLLFGDVRRHMDPLREERRHRRLIGALLCGRELLGKFPLEALETFYKFNTFGPHQIFVREPYPALFIDYDFELLECTLKYTPTYGPAHLRTVEYIRPGDLALHPKFHKINIIDFAMTYLKTDPKDSLDIAIKKQRMLELLRKYGHKP